MTVEITIGIQDGNGSETRVVRKFYPRFSERWEIAPLIEQQAQEVVQQVGKMIPFTPSVPEREAL